MEESETARLNHRKESCVMAGSACTTPDSRLGGNACPGDDIREDKSYPFALVLRLRVLQIVLGISTLVMGTVGIIEERGRINLGLGLPAGCATVLAAAASIHMSRGFGGYRPSSCGPGSPLRFLGPSLRVAGSLVGLWGAACLLHLALVVQASRTLAQSASNDLTASEDNVYVLSAVELGLALSTLMAVAAVLGVDCRYDPD